jgi:DNA polymerase III subunit gamma/tau
MPIYFRGSWNRKNSTAKIFARAINCLNPNEGDPCNVCEICRGILSEQMMDVLEIDAASNNGVDHIREIRESVKYPPIKARYKVYIIDEVHMLSTGAFNALLKTLEEPPDHVVFILATTEIQKIPATVLSRCLRFTFKPLGLEEIRQRLLTICRSLDVDYEEAAVTTIALNGEGALRDSLSILDQCLAYHPGELHYHQVTEVLGSINESLLFQLADHYGQTGAAGSGQARAVSLSGRKRPETTGHRSHEAFQVAADGLPQCSGGRMGKFTGGDPEAIP